MTNIKEYITYTRFYEKEDLTISPLVQIKNLWKDILSFSPTIYGEAFNSVDKVYDNRQIGIIKYDDSLLTEEIKIKFLNNMSIFSMVTIKPIKAVSLCNELMPSPEGKADYFTLDSDNFTIVDKRPLD